MSNAITVGKQLYALCQQGKALEAINTLYAPNVVSVESVGNEHMPRQMEGIDAIRGKNEWWYENTEVHSAEMRGPFPHGEDRFAVFFDMDCTNKVSKERSKLQEVGVYTVAGGKIVREEFFYGQS